jgi:hypothetical protein
MSSWTLALAVVLVAGAARAEAWTVRAVARTGGPGTTCVLESAPASISDGYQTTTAQVVVDQEGVTVTSASVLDPSFDDIAIVVDDELPVPMDRLAGPRAARFESRHALLVEQFKRGARARLQLRFWPTWPATGTHSTVISLIGFTRAHAGLAECR